MTRAEPSVMISGLCQKHNKKLRGKGKMRFQRDLNPEENICVYRYKKKRCSLIIMLEACRS